MHLTTTQARHLGIDVPKAKRKKAAARKPATKGESSFQAVCVGYGLPRPEPEFPFAPPREWKVDWLFPGKVGVEIEGSPFIGKPCPLCGLRSGGRHQRGKGFLGDIEKYNALAILGYCLIRVTWDEVNSGSAFTIIRRALESRSGNVS